MQTTIQELIYEANRIYRDEPCGEVSADAILTSLAILAASGKRASSPTAYQPANPDRVVEHFAGAAREVLVTTAAETYRAIYERDGNTAELRTMAGALRAAGWVAYRSNGRSMWRRRNPLVDGLYGLENGPEIHREILKWADAQPYGIDGCTATKAFQMTFKREPTGVEARATGAVLREAGYASKKSNGRTVFTGRRPGVAMGSDGAAF